MARHARRRKPVRRLAAIGCAALLVVTGCGGEEHEQPDGFAADAVVTAEREGAPRPADDDPHLDGPEDEPDDEAVPDVVAAQPWPVAVAIPALGVHADLVTLGLNDDRSMEVPDFGLAGWYEEGPRPGAPGPAVIAAHYDSRDGPDVFYELAALDAGDEIHVHRDDGSIATFVVEDLAQHPKDELPGDDIWAPSDEPRLTLITCGGVFDRATGHYTDNVIAYATASGP